MRISIRRHPVTTPNLQLFHRRAISNIDTVADNEKDTVGHVYEYVLGKFAATEGKGGGEFYTPKCVVNLIAETREDKVTYAARR